MSDMWNYGLWICTNVSTAAAWAPLLRQPKRHRCAKPSLAVQPLILELQLGIPGPAHGFWLWRKLILERRAARSVEPAPDAVATANGAVVRRLELRSEAKVQADPEAFVAGAG